MLRFSDQRLPVEESKVMAHYDIQNDFYKSGDLDLDIDPIFDREKKLFARVLGT